MIKNPLLNILKPFITPYTLYWGAAIGAVVSAVGSASAADKAAKAQQAAAAQASAGTAFNPYEVSGAFGTGQFDGTTARTELTPEMQRLQQQYASEASQFSRQGQTGIGARAGALGQGLLDNMQADPFAAAESQFAKMEEILNPARGRQREALEARLLRQGRLGSTGGALQQQGLEGAIEESRQKGLYDALQQSQGMQNQQAALGTQLGLFGQQQDVGFNQAQARLGGMQSLDQSALQYLNLGGAFGGRQSQAGALGGQFDMQGAAAGSAAQLGAASGFAKSANKIGSAFDSWNNTDSNPYQSALIGNDGSYQEAKTEDEWANDWGNE